MAINIVNILKCLIWKQLKVQRFTELLASLLMCGVIWLVVRSEPHKPDEPATSVERTDHPLARQRSPGDLEVFYEPVTNFTRGLMRAVCGATCIGLSASGNTTRRVVSSRRQPTITALVRFHGEATDGVPGGLNFTIGYSVKNPRSHRFNHPGQFRRRTASQLQRRIHQRYMDMVGVPWRDYAANVTDVGLDEVETPVLRFLLSTVHTLDIRIVKTILFKFAFIFIVKTVKDVMRERYTLMKHMTILCNVPEIFVWIGHIIQRLITNIFIAFVIALILKDYEKVSWYVLWGFLTLFCLVGIIQGFFFACLTNDYNLNVMMMIICWFMIYPLYKPDMSGYYLFYCICPGFAFQLGYQLIDEQRYQTSHQTRSVPSIWMQINPFENSNKPHLVHVVMMLCVDILWMSVATYVFNKLRVNKYGTTWCFVPLYFLVELCCELCGVEAFEQSSISLLPQYPNEKAEVGSVALSLVRVYKVYRLGLGPHRRRTVAVRNFSVDFEKNTNTVILSESYGGKSTLMNIMAGLTYATIGRVIVNGTIGYCAQENIHCEDLSILDLITFFGMLRGYDTRKAKREATKLLLELNLFDDCDNNTSQLRHSEQRKLSIAMAVIGDIDILLIDEPTTGVRGTVKREIWSFLLKFRGAKTLIISTKDTLEAEVLGDRLAVVSNGMLHCYGSTWYIKGLYRYGYTLTVVGEKNFNSQRTQDILKKHVTVVDIIHDMNPVFIVALASLDVQRYPGLFDELESSKSYLGIVAFHLEPASMEDVFSLTNQNQLQSPTTPALHDSSADQEPELANKPKTKLHATGKALALLRFCALLKRKFQFMVYKWPVYIFVLLFSVLATAGAILRNSEEIKYDNRSCGERLKNAVIYRYKRSDFQTEYWMNALINTIYHFSDHVIYHDSSMGTRISKRIPSDAVVFQVSDMEPKAIHVKMLHVKQCTRTQINDMITNIILRCELENPPAVRTLVDRFNYESDSVIPLYWCFLVGFVFSLAVPLAVSLPLHEKKNMFKLQLQLAGVTRFMYWLTIFIADMVYYIIYTFVLMICIIMLDSYFADEIIWIAMISLMLTFSAVGALSTYIFTFYFRSKPMVYLVLFLACFLSVMVPGALLEWRMTVLDEIAEQSTMNNAKIMRNLHIEYYTCIVINVVMMLLPPVAFNQGLFDLFTGLNQIEICRNTLYMVEERCDRCYDRLFKCCQLNCKLTVGGVISCPDDASFLMSFYNGIALSLVFLFLDCFIVISLLYLYELRFLHNENYDKYSKLIIAADPEVIQEKRNVEAALKGDNDDQATTSRQYKLLVSGIHKRFGAKIGAAGLTFGVESNTGFALFGPDNAGKSTTLRILAGAEAIFGGDAFIGDASLAKDRTKYFSQISHCPETNPGNSALTVEDTLDLLMAITGVRLQHRRFRIDLFINALKLEDYRYNKVSTLNDDTRRKLSFVQALLPAKDFVLLDEPTRGMTQQTRRLIWHLLQRYIDHGGTFLLASDNLIECEALCTRIAYLDHGQIRHIGSKASLVKRLGKAFSIFVKLRTIGWSKQAIMALRRDIESRFKVVLTDDYPEFLCYKVSQVDASLSSLFTAMEQLKKSHRIIEGYSIIERGLQIKYSDLEVQMSQVKPMPHNLSQYIMNKSKRRT